MQIFNISTLLRQISRIFSLALIFSIYAGLINAGPGDFDNAFGSGGQVFTNIGEGTGPDTRLSKFLVQPDGKYVMVGGINIAQSFYEFGIARFHPDGTLDRSFGTDGKIQPNLPTETEFAQDVALQGDGKIVVVGYGINPSGSTEYFITIIRYNSDGTLDTGFNGSGIIQTNYSRTLSGITKSVKIDSSGRIVIAGYLGSSGPIFVARFNFDGTPDLSFGGGTGAVTYRIGTNQYNRATDLVIQPDGKLITVGVIKPTFNSPNQFFQISRLNPDGTLDLSFNNTGWLTAGFDGNISNIASSAVIQSDDKILVLGSTQGSSLPSKFALLRLNSNGSFDNTFDGDGRVTTNVESAEANGFDIALQPDGKIIAGGYARIGLNDYLTAIRYLPDGNLDTTFNGDGKKRLDIPAERFSLNAGIIVENNGKVVIGGESHMPHTAFTLARLDQTGALDITFGGTYFGNGIAPPGVAKTFLGFSSDQPTSIVVQSDGKIIVGGNSDRFISIARYNPDGSIDQTFADRGRSKIILPGNYNSIQANKILIQTDGKILLAGYIAQTFPSPGFIRVEFLIIRLNTDGSLDSGFNGTGFANINFGLDDAVAYGAVLQPDGKIILAGRVDLSSSQAFAAARFNSNGTLDTDFGSKGQAVYDLSNWEDVAIAAALQPDGKIFLAGTYNNRDLCLTRLTADGQLDKTFNSKGFITADIENFSNDVGTDFIRQSDGKLLLLGYSGKIGIFRFNPDGTPDNSFGNQGKVVQTPLNPFDRLEKFAVQQNNKLVLVGRTNAASFINNFCTYRFNENGTLDQSFGENGRVATNFRENITNEASTVSVQADGKLIVAGTVGNFYGQDFALVRYQGDRVFQFRSIFDFDGDGKTDISIFRPSVGEWWYLRSSDGGNRAFQFGAFSDKVVAADFTGDGKTDIAVFRPESGEWFVFRSEDNSFYSFAFGTNGDIPTPADFDGDGIDDVAIFRPTNATWYIIRSRDGGTTITTFGANGDQPVAADYDGDGFADVAIFRPSDGSWWVSRSTGGVTVTNFGTSSDKTVQADYTGDGKADIAFWRPSTGEWFVLRSEDSSFYSVPFGVSGDIAAPGDYDGDGAADYAVFRPSNATWYVQQSTNGFAAVGFGALGDQPVPNAFVR